MQYIDFNNSGYIIKPPQPSSAFYRAPIFVHYTLFVWSYNVKKSFVCLGTNISVAPTSAIAGKETQSNLQKLTVKSFG